MENFININGFKTIEDIRTTFSLFIDNKENQNHYIVKLVKQDFSLFYINRIKPYFIKKFYNSQIDFDFEDLTSILYIILSKKLNDLTKKQIESWTDLDTFFRQFFTFMKYGFYSYLSNSSRYQDFISNKRYKDYLENIGIENLDKEDIELLKKLTSTDDYYNKTFNITLPKSLDELKEQNPLFDINSKDLMIDDVLIDREERIRKIKKISDFLKTLNDRYKRIFIKIYMYGENSLIVAEEEHCSQQRISEIVLRIKRKIKQFFKVNIYRTYNYEKKHRRSKKNTSEL